MEQPSPPLTKEACTQCKKSPVWTNKRRAKKEIELAVKFLCPDLDPLYQQIMERVIHLAVKKTCETTKKLQTCTACDCHCVNKGDLKDECKENCTCGCKGTLPCGCKSQEVCMCYTGKTDFKSHVRKVAKTFLFKFKTPVKSMIDVSTSTFKRLRGHMPPIEGKFSKKFVKASGKLLEKIHKKDLKTKEEWEQMSEKYWSEYIDKVAQKVKGRVEKIAKMALYYIAPSECDATFQVVGTKCLSNVMIMLLHRKITEHIREKDEKKETRIHRRRDFIGCGKKKKKDWKSKIREGCINFCLTYLQDKQEALKMCTEAVRSSLPPELANDSYTTAKIVNWCLACTPAEKIAPEFCREFAKAYANNCIISPKNEKQEKLEKLQKHTKIALLMQSAKNDTAYLGRKIGAVMCHKALKENYSKEKVAAFLGTWSKTFAPILEDARKIIEEFTKGKMEQYGEYNVKKMMKKVTERYVLMYCSEGKWEKEEFRKHLLQVMANKKSMVEKYSHEIEMQKAEIEGKKA